MWKKRITGASPSGKGMRMPPFSVAETNGTISLYKALTYLLPVVPLFPNIITKDAGNKIAVLRLSVWRLSLLVINHYHSAYLQS